MVDGLCSINYLDLIVGVKQIVVIDESLPAIAFIADNHIMDNNTNVVLFKRSGYGSAYFSGSAYWVMRPYHYNKYGVEYYTDIDTTSGNIVLSALSTDSLTLRLQVFNRTLDYAGNSTPPYIYLTNRYCHNDHTLASKPMLTALEGDTFAVAYHTKAVNDNGYLAVKKYSINATVPSLEESMVLSMSGVNDNNTLMIRDMRYNRRLHRLMILNDSPHPMVAAFGSYVHIIDMWNMSVGAHTLAHPPLHFSEYSLDIYEDDGFILSGREISSGQLMTYFEMLHMPFSCGQRYDLTKYKRTNPLMHVISRHHCTIVPVCQNVLYAETPVPNTVTNTCLRNNP